MDTLADSISEFGGSTTATVTRITDDLSSSLTVALSASDTDEVTVPAEVTIPAGRTFTSFAIDGKDDDLLDGTKEVIITADAAGFVQGVDSLAIDDHETIKLTIAADSISENGGTTTATVTRSNTDVSDDLIVRVSSSDTSEVTVPITVIIPGGSQTSEPFAIAGKDDALLDGDLPVTIFVAAPDTSPAVTS